MLYLDLRTSPHSHERNLRQSRHSCVFCPRQCHNINIKRRLRTDLNIASPIKVIDTVSNLQLTDNFQHISTTEKIPYQDDTDEQSWSADHGTLPSVWQRLAQARPHDVLLEDPHRGGVTISAQKLWECMLQLASGLQGLGLARYDKVCLFSENSCRWLIADQAVMLNGCANCVRGSTAPGEELAYIMVHSQASAIILQDVETLSKLSAAIKTEVTVGPPRNTLKFVIVLWGEEEEIRKEREALGLPEELKVLSYQQVLRSAPFQPAKYPGPDSPSSSSSHDIRQHSFRPPHISSSDIATLVYTSGTTGNPKAVKLTHANLMYQVENLSHFLPVKEGQSVLSLLPPWHIYERSASYYVLSCGGKLIYTNIRKFKDDLPKYRPDHFVCVPLVLDTLYTRIKQQFSAMPAPRRSLVTFLLTASTAFIKAQRIVQGLALQFALQPASQLQLLQAWLTATVLRPIHALATLLVYSKVRAAIGIQHTVVCGGGSLAPHLDDFYEVLGLSVLNGWGLTETSPVLACRRSEKNVRGSIGVPTPGTEIHVVDVDTLLEVEDGVQGLLLARGPGVFSGYSEDQAASEKAFRAGDGWFDTGDLGWRVPTSSHNEAMRGNLVISGRVKDTIVLSSGKKVEPEPIEGALTCSNLIKHVVLIGQDKRELGALIFPEQELLDAALATSSEPARGDRMGSSVASSSVRRSTEIGTPLSIEDGTLTRTMKPRRPEIARKYSKEVAELLQRLRGDQT
ncbi:hypothetical protein CEUSTIGMA_g10227.t1 [Chlamydomonas eustigma]|uniref:AMP-dependent synthetase/ligase domain-containing protein n=1 Tax=Chlamydomonas eustigma TaxID=1157962 RepID=A0A250XI92_9CHLO|nr:hypothetical protein CEUSTIGMA_g10227.t1 [Chlamydomonas eustigma]|eukprot:GAX82801.1 hypothetical protein CEUSTIGMA_g10227.t1 [Chlamydomonas eustigma]